MEDKHKKSLEELDVQLNVTRDYLKLRKELIGEDIPDELKTDGRSNNSEEDTLDGFSQSELKTNLEQKVAICENIEKLTDDDIIYAYHKKLPEYRREFLSIGPVAPNLQEDIQYRFESGSKQIEEKYNNFLMDGMDVTKKKKEYFAFISYKSEDVEWATWLQHELEHYHLPASYNGRTDVPHELRPVFRDIDELSAGNLPEQIRQALTNSQNLIIICSPQAAKSPWVNQEVETFISLGRTERIFPFIVEGNSPSEFFPPALRNLPKDEERLGGDISKKGRDAAFVKVVAGMLGVDFDSLWNRYEKEKAEEERKQREQRDKLLISQSRFVAEKVGALLENGDSIVAKLLALEILPGSLSNPNRPFTPESERALREAYQSNFSKINNPGGWVFDVAFSPNGKIIASASYDHIIRLWDVNSGMCLKELKGHEDYVLSVCFNSDGTSLLSASQDKTIRKWNLQKGICTKIFIGHTNTVFSAKYNCECDKIVSSSWDETVRIWDVDSGECIRVLQGHKYGSYSATFSKDGKRVVAGTGYVDILLWDVQSGKCIKKLEGHKDIVGSVCFTPDEMYIISGSKDYTIRIWNTDSGCCEKIFTGHKGQVNSVCCDKTGTYIVSASEDNTILVWDFATGTVVSEMTKHVGGVTNIRWDSKDMKLVSSSYDQTIRIWHPFRNLSCLRVIKKHTQNVYCASFSPNDKLIVSTGGDGLIYVWDILSDEPLLRLKPSTGTGCSALFTHNGDKIISSESDGNIRIWNSKSGELEKILRGHTEEVNISLSKAGDKIISCSLDKTIRIWNVENGECIKTITGHTNYVHSAELNRDGSKVVSASWDETVRIWDVQTNNCLGILRSPSGYAYSASFSPDDNLILTSHFDHTIRLWDAKKFQLLKILSGHNEYVVSAKFSRTGKYIVSASGDGTIKVWDTQSGVCLNTFYGHNGAVLYASFNNEEDKIVSTSEDYTVRIWKFCPLQQLIIETKDQLGKRQLTHEERIKYYFE